MLTSCLSERLLLTLWVGALWAIGYLAVPMAFMTLNDTQLAGEFAGELFVAVSILGVGCGSVLIIRKLIKFKAAVLQYWRFWVVVVMVLLTMLLSLYLQPQIAELKQLDWKTDGVLLQQFGLLHSLSENIYLILSLLGLALVVSSDDELKFTQGVNNG